MKIQLVDDEPVSLWRVERLLKRESHEVVVGRDGEEAWGQFKRKPVRVVISDWDMPQCDGLELCRRIRARQSVPYTYFILLSARNPKEEVVREAVESGVDDFLLKPVARLALWARLRVAERILSFTTQIGQLQALLPICSYCKKIRDDQTYWHSVESYLAEHAGVGFTHGICPDCYQRHVQPALPPEN